MTDANASAGYNRALNRAGQTVTIQRWNGQAPNRFSFSATVVGLVRNAVPDSAEVSRTGFSEGKQGSITQTERHVIVRAQDLINARFPLPIKKNDKVVVQGETLNVTEADPNTRIFAGAIDLTVTGV